MVVGSEDEGEGGREHGVGKEKAAVSAPGGKGGLPEVEQADRRKGKPRKGGTRSVGFLILGSLSGLSRKQSIKMRATKAGSETSEDQP